MASAHAFRFGRTVAAAVVVALVLGCATNPPREHNNGSNAASTSPFAGPARERLVRTAKSQASNPVTLTEAPPLPAGLQPGALDPIADPALLELALTPTDEVLESLRRGVAEPRPHEFELGPDAMRLYVAGRRLALDGDAATAVERLKSASELASDSADIFRELGEAQLSNNQRVAAVRSFARAFELGSRSPRVLVILASDADRRGDQKRSAELFAAALDQDAGRYDSALPSVIRAGLGESLLGLGYERAGSAMLRRALDLPRPAGLRSTRYAPQLRELYRRQPDLWITVGDSSCRLGEYDEALDAYAHASGDGSIDTGGALGRQIYVLVLLGRPAASGLALLESIELSGMLVDNRQLSVIRSIALESPTTRDQLAAVLSQANAKLEGRAPPSVLSGMALARAASMKPDPARAVLSGYLDKYPSNTAVLAAIFAGYDAADAPGIAQEAIDLVRANPTRAESITRAALAATYSYADFIGVIDTDTSHSAVLVHAYALSIVGYAVDAYAVVEQLTEPLSIGDRAAKATLAELAGDRAKSTAQIEQLLAEGSPDARRAAADVHRRAQHPHDARVVLLALINDDPTQADVELQLKLADLCVTIGLLDEAERHAIAAISLDPADETAYRGLITLYQRPQNSAQQQALTEIVRQLRAAVPSSLMLREIAARENLRRGLLDVAEEQLIGIVETNPGNERSYQLLVGLWEQAARRDDIARLERAEQWLRLRLEERPESALDAGSLARVHVADVFPEEAIRVADATIERRPSFALERMRESIMREQLDRAEEADRLALARLDRGPMTIDTAIERTAVLMRMGRIGAAAESLERGYDPTQTLNVSQHVNLVNLMRLKIELVATQGEPDFDASSSLVEAIVAYEVPFTPEAHAYRAGLLARSTGFSPAKARDALDLFVSQHPDQVTRAYLIVSAELANAGHGRTAIELIADAAELHREAEIRDQWIRLAAVFGDEESFGVLVDRLAELRVLAQTVDQIASDDEDRTTMPIEGFKTEMIYLIGNLASRGGFDDQAEKAYRAALARDPRHAWSNNNLGYGLAERGENLEEAERMLLIAVEEEPMESSIIDSLGWLRYKQGRIDDTIDENGQIVSEGSLTLLRRANRLPKGMRNVTILDHLGDAAWLAGVPSEATNAWQRATSELRRQAQNATRNQLDPKPLQDELVRLRRKVDMAGKGIDPEVAESAFRAADESDEPSGG